jgi:hypothetical protein
VFFFSVFDQTTNTRETSDLIGFAPRILTNCAPGGRSTGYAAARCKPNRQICAVDEVAEINNPSTHLFVNLTAKKQRNWRKEGGHRPNGTRSVSVSRRVGLFVGTVAC